MPIFSYVLTSRIQNVQSSRNPLAGCSNKRTNELNWSFVVFCWSRKCLADSTPSYIRQYLCQEAMVPILSMDPPVRQWQEAPVARSVSDLGATIRLLVLVCRGCFGKIDGRKVEDQV